MARDDDGLQVREQSPIRQALQDEIDNAIGADGLRPASGTCRFIALNPSAVLPAWHVVGNVVAVALCLGEELRRENERGVVRTVGCSLGFHQRSKRRVRESVETMNPDN